MLVYVDDIVVSPQTPCLHIGDTRLFFSFLKESTASLKMDKPSFPTSKIDYSVYVADADRFEVVDHTSKAILELKIPTKGIVLRLFIRFCIVFGWSVLNFSHIALTLATRLCKTQEK